jgi:hypothetical protein
MLEFPSYNLTIFLALLFIGAGCTIIFGSYQMFILARLQEKLVSIKTPPTDVTPDEQPAGRGQAFMGFGGGSIFLLAGMFLAYFAIGEAAEIARFRAIETSNVRALRIIKIEDGSLYNINSRAKDSASRTVEFTDRDSIQSAFSGLKNCNSVWFNRDSFKDGYKLEPILDNGNPKGFYVAVFRENTNKSNGPLVIASVEGAERPYSGYQCMKFQEWVKKTIDPLFSEDIKAK